MICTTQQELLIKFIEEKRNQMIYFGIHYGFTHKKTLKCSKELDKLIQIQVIKLMSK
ncbi:aspartyl-phosphate phosphatase Spo0E family protein [Priestia aryabhattai]|uniref:aspartyl-phosphate phosphatase Spo0E family protein n=1 Tax=Priestia aryabhattai TaxID=412384 RepID=UPI00289B979C